MALNSTGAISLGGSTAGQSVAVELGRSATAAISLNDPAVRTLAGVASGAISLYNFYSKSNASSQSYTTPGTYSWVAPAAVTSVSVVAVGGGGAFGRYNETYFECPNYFRTGPGGGGGGGLGYKNNYAVTPGNSYTVVVGAAGTAPAAFNADPTSGGDSYFVSTAVVKGGGGGSGTTIYAAGAGGTYTGDGGGNGGAGALGGGAYQGGPGGAGGYSGNGGAGVTIANNGNAGSGGGGGSPGFTYGSIMGGSGGVGLFGQGSNGTAGNSSGTPGGGGSGGSAGGAGTASAYPQGMKGGAGGTYGGVMGTSGYGGWVNTNTPLQSSASGGGAVRIVWPGTTRQFPSTSVGSP